jgi:DNA-binding YbaB/EbfC family protein
MNIEEMMKQAQKVQEEFKKLQQKLVETEFFGESGAGSVKVVLLGNFRVKKINIDPNLLKPEEKEILEDLLIAAINDARNQIEQNSSTSIKNITDSAGGAFDPKQ